MAQQFYIIILEEFFMTPILSLHNIDVAEFLAILDTCEGNVFLVTDERRQIKILKANSARSSVLQNSLRAVRLPKQALFARIKRREQTLPF